MRHEHHIVDGRNPAPPKKPWNDDSLVNTNQQWFPMVSKWSDMDFVTVPRNDQVQFSCSQRPSAHKETRTVGVEGSVKVEIADQMAHSNVARDSSNTSVRRHDYFLTLRGVFFWYHTQLSTARAVGRNKLWLADGAL